MKQLDLHASLDLFASRLDTLEHLLRRADEHFEGDPSFLDLRVAPDMFDLRTQVACICNQPRHLVHWCEGQALPTSSPELTALAQVLAHIEGTKALLQSLGETGASAPQRSRITLGPGLQAAMPAHEYANDFLVPNFYFHLVTAYAILRMAGLPIGKADYMQHMRGLIQHNDGATMV